MGALLSLLSVQTRKPHHVEGDCHCACDDQSENSDTLPPQKTSTKSAAVARDSPT